MPDFLLCTVEDTFQIAGRGLVVAPLFPVAEYHFEANQSVRVVSPSGNALECKAFFQIPHQSPPAKVLSYCCALQEVAKEDVPIGSQLWLINRKAEEVVRGSTPKPQLKASGA